MIPRYALFLAILAPLSLECANHSATSAADPHIAEQLRKLPLAFEKNEGQAPAATDFVARGGGYGVALSGANAYISLVGGQTNASAAVALRLVGSNAKARPAGRNHLPGTVNYFVGNDPSLWHAGVPTFARVEYSGVYPGVDVAYYGAQGRLEYDFIVAPGAHPSEISLALEGARGLEIDAAGDLRLQTTAGTIRFLKPVSYQPIGGRRRPVASSYRLLADNHVGFKIGSYDRRFPLVIDPSLSYSTYLGGSAFDYGTAIAVNSAGNAFVTGYTSSMDFPTKSPEQSYFPGSSAIFVAELASNGASLVYATYLGGSVYNYPYSIAVDSTGAAYVAGLTESYDFPLQNALDSTLNGGEDAFITKIAAGGGSLVFSTFLGGSGADYALGLALDSSKNVYVAGSTQSSDFPTTAGAYQSDSAGSCSFVTKINAAGSALAWSTYFGQSCSAQATSLAVDSLQSVYLTGTAFPGLPVTSGAPQQNFGGGVHDAFMAKLSNNGANLAYCTYLGGSQSDAGASIAVDASGNAYATGSTQSTDLPVSLLALQNTSGGGFDAFVAELNPTGTAWLYLTYLGGQRDDFGNGIALDSSGDAFVAGYTISNNFTTVSAVQGALAGNQHILYKTTASGKTWSSSDTGLPATPVVIAVDPASDSHWMAATSEGLYQSTDGGSQWDAISYFQGVNMYSVAFSPSGGTVYASSFTNIYSSSDSGNTWAFAGVAPCAASNMAVSPGATATLFLGSSCSAESIDGGQTWTTLNGFADGDFFYGFAIDPQSASVMYAATAFGLYNSTDGGQSWSAVNLAGLQLPFVTGVVINSHTPATIYAIANGSVYGSTNSGGTWTLKSTGITSQVNSLAIAPSKPTVLYAGTASGVFLSSNSGTSWKSAGETGNPISLVIADTVSSSTAYAATSVNPDAFVAKIASGGLALLYSTYLGGTGLDYALGIAVSSSGNALITGSAQSPDFPTTHGVLQPATGLLRTSAFVSSIATKTGSCSEAVSPTTAFFYAAGGPANFSVTAPSGCSWTPKASASWITVSSHGGPGVGDLAIKAAANTGAQRSGSVKLGKTTVTITQAASGCRYSLSASGLNFIQPGGSQNINVTAGTGCEWVVTGLPEWLSIVSGATGTGNGTVTLNAVSNPFPGSRGGFATVAGTSIGVVQNGTSQ